MGETKGVCIIKSTEIHRQHKILLRRGDKKDLKGEDMSLPPQLSNMSSGVPLWSPAQETLLHILPKLAPWTSAAWFP